MNKRGWIHILEATIGVMIVAGVMVTVYSDQSFGGGFDIGDFVYSLQNEILDTITINADLRIAVLNVVVDSPGDPSFDRLNSAVAAEIPDSYGYLLRVCNLGDPNDVCNMPPIIFTATLDKDVFVEEAVVSSEVGDGTDVIYSPKKLRLFFWEEDEEVEEDPAEDGCLDECLGGSKVCSIGSPSGIVTTTCVDSNGDGCLEISSVNTPCASGFVCDSNSVTCEDQGCVSTCSDDRYCANLGPGSRDNADVFGWECDIVDGCEKLGDSYMIQNCGGGGCGPDSDGVAVCRPGVGGCVDECSEDLFCSGSGNNANLFRYVCDIVDGCSVDGGTMMIEDCGRAGCGPDSNGVATCNDDVGSCQDECNSEGVIRSCSGDGGSSLVETCEYGSSGCLERSVDTISCGDGRCVGGVCG